MIHHTYKLVTGNRCYPYHECQDLVQVKGRNTALYYQLLHTMAVNTGVTKEIKKCMLNPWRSANLDGTQRPNLRSTNAFLASQICTSARA